MTKTIKALLIDDKGFTYTIDVEDPPPQLVEWAYIKRNRSSIPEFRKCDLPIEGPAVKKLVFELASCHYRCAIYTEILKGSGE